MTLINTYPINTYLLYLSLLLGFIPVLLAFFFPKKTKNLRLISIYLFAALFTDLFLNPISEVYFNSQFVASKIFTVIEFLLVSLFLFPLIQLKLKKLIFIVFSSLFIVTIFTENILINNQDFDSVSTGVSALIVLIYSIIYLFSKLSFDLSPESFKIDATFLIVSSILIYFSGTFFIYILTKNNYLDEDFRSSYSLINALVLTSRNLIIVFAFFKSLKPSFNQSTYITPTKYSI